MEDKQKVVALEFSIEKRSMATVRKLLDDHHQHTATLTGITVKCEDVIFPDGTKLSINQPAAIAAKLEEIKKSKIGMTKYLVGKYSDNVLSVNFHKVHSVSGKQSEV